MTALSPSTLRRLRKLPKLPVSWEGDRRPLPPHLLDAPEGEFSGECILWLDRSAPAVRAMDMVPAGIGLEAVTRTLLRAMEQPHSGLEPGRPQKIFVCNREIQLFFRGVLKDLDIEVEYSKTLPLCDELFAELRGSPSFESSLPQELTNALLDGAELLLNDEPWVILDETRVLAVELNHSDVETLYVSILGMAGVEAGFLMYRSLDSLKRFRQQVVNSSKESMEGLQAAFLSQDCFFLNYLSPEGDPAAAFEEDEDIEFEFGTIHPLEGIRPTLDEEEAVAVILTLNAMHRFFDKHWESLASSSLIFPDISSRFRIPHPLQPTQKISVRVSTQPQVALELVEEMDGSKRVKDRPFPPAKLPFIRDDLRPKEMSYTVGWMPETLVLEVRRKAKLFQAAEIAFEIKAGELPVFGIQTTRPQAKQMLAAIEAAGTPMSLCWVPGEDPLSGDRFDICLLQTKDGTFHLLAEFDEDAAAHIRAKQKWDRRCQQTQGICGFTIARGLKGANSGSPTAKEIVALFEIPSKVGSELGLETLQRFPLP